jgi:Tol biopolymer transport system component
MRLEVNTPTTTDPISFAISPDGRRLVFAGSDGGTTRLWLRTLDTTMSRPLIGTEGGGFPFWSPDSRSIGFFSGGKLWRLDVDGGAPLELAEVNVGRGGSWSPDGVILFGRSQGVGLFRVSASGGEVTAVSRLEARQTSHRFPQFLPDGRRFLYFVQGPGEVQGVTFSTSGKEHSLPWNLTPLQLRQLAIQSESLTWSGTTRRSGAEHFPFRPTA